MWLEQGAQIDVEVLGFGALTELLRVAENSMHTLVDDRGPDRNELALCCAEVGRHRCCCGFCECSMELQVRFGFGIDTAQCPLNPRPRGREATPALFRFSSWLATGSSHSGRW